MRIAKHHKKVIRSWRRSYDDRDQGLMESLAVLMKLGIFTDDGRTADRPNDEIGSLIFEDVSIHLNQRGKNFVHVTKNDRRGDRFIQFAALNKQELARPYFQHGDLGNGHHWFLLRASSHKNEEFNKLN
ncbi:MAG: glycoside hydrolase family 92 protein [Cyclobacteriaceae bacterium]|nr:glycoside hydrolase family 92 protein [Cyclobacteriaceae bacterium SS2]